MPRLASDVRTTLVGLERNGDFARALAESLRSAIDQAAARRRLHRRGPRPTSCWAATTSTSGEFAAADETFERAAARARAEGTPGCPTPPRRAGSTASRSRSRAGGTSRSAVLDITGEVVPPDLRRPRSTRDAGADPGRAAASRAPRRSPVGGHPFWRQEGLVAITGGSAELARSDEHCRRPRGRSRDVPPIVDTADRHLAPALPGARPAGHHRAGGLRDRREPPQRGRACRRRPDRRGPRRRRPERARPPRRPPSCRGSRGPRVGGATRRRAAALDWLPTSTRRPGRAGRRVARGRSTSSAASAHRYEAAPGAGPPGQGPAPRSATPTARGAAGRGRATTPRGSVRRAAPDEARRRRPRAAADGPRPAHPARARDPRPGGRGAQQRRDRPAAVHLDQDGQRARLQRDGQARRVRAAPRPSPSRAAGLLG